MTDEQSVAVEALPPKAAFSTEPTQEGYTHVMTGHSAITVDESTPQFSTSPTIAKLASALARVQKKLKQPRKGSDNPFFKSKYADLHEVWASVAGLLADEGIACIQTPAFTTAELKGKIMGIVCISTTLVHGESGEWMTNVMRGTTEQIGPQAIGSAISYFRRYSIQPMLMLTPDDGSDDDGERAEGRKDSADPADKPTAEYIAATTKAIKETTTLDALKTLYAEIPEAHKRFFNKLVGARKGVIEEGKAKPLGPPLTNPEEENPPVEG